MGLLYLNRIQKMLLLRVLLVPALFLSLMCAVIVYYFSYHAGQQVKKNLIRIAVDHSNLIEFFLKEKTSLLKFIINDNDFEQLKISSNLNKLFLQLQAESKAFIDLGLFDDHGNHIAYTGHYDLTGKNYSKEQWFISVQEKGIFISDEFLGFRNIPHFIIAVQNNSNNKKWYLRATIDTYFFNDLVESIRIKKTGEAYIINKEGIFQTRRRSGGKLMEKDTDFHDYKMEKSRISSFTAGGRFGFSYLYATVPLKQTDWIMVVRQAATDAYGPLIFTILTAACLILGGILITGLAGFIATSNIANQLKLANVEKREMKTQLIIAGKLAEIGEMSTGIAHEINNPLQVIKAELAMIKEIMPDIESLIKNPDAEALFTLKDSTNQVNLQVERCRRITQGLLNFSRKSEPEIIPVELQALVPEIVRMVDQRARLADIRITQIIDPDIPKIMSDPNQLQQVFLNMINNAIHALSGRPKKEIRITIIHEGQDIVITIADNGCGFSPDDMEKAFLPFFTTKPVGQGTGLGLSTVYGIINGLGGDIILNSELNAGSTFTIRLPLEKSAENTNQGI